MDEFSTLLEEIRFSERFRGYDPDEVDAYAHAVAKAAAQMHGRVQELQERVEAAESRLTADTATSETEQTLTRTLVMAQRTADAALADAEAEAARMLTEAEERSTNAVSEAEERSAVLLSAAQSQAAALMADADSAASTRLRDAQERSSRILAEAETDRRRILADAEFEAAAALTTERDRILAEITELEANRDTLKVEIDGLDHHVAEQRTQLQRALSALRSLIEDPANFGLVDSPAHEPAADVVDLTEPAPRVVEPGTTIVEDATDTAGDTEPAPRVVEPGTTIVEDATDTAGDVAVDQIADEFATPVDPSPTDSVPPSDSSVPLIDDYEHPDMVVEELASDGAVDLPVIEDEADVVPPVPSIEDEAAEVIDMTDSPVPSDPEPVDLIEHDIDLVTEAPVDAEIVPDDDQPPSVGGSVAVDDTTDADVRTAQPRFVTAEDLDEQALDEQALDEQAEELGSDRAGPPVDHHPDTAGGSELIDFDTMDAESVAAPVSEVPSEHPSLFEPDPRADDAFLAQLREAVAGTDHPLPDDVEDDALSAFFEGDNEERQRGWFGRKR